MYYRPGSTDISKELQNITAASGPLRPSPMLGFFVLLEVFVFFFVPKVNLLELPGLTVQAKPEDLIWLLMIPLLILHRPALGNRAALALVLMVGYLTLSAFWFPTNAVMVVRLLLYAFPLLYSVSLSARDSSRLVRMIRIFLYGMSIVACLQVVAPFPYFHTGEFLIGPVDRASGIYGNGVEFALMALFAFWLHHFLGGNAFGPWLAGVAITYFSGTRLASLAMLASGIVFIRHWSWRRICGLVLMFAVVVVLAIRFTSQEGASRFSDVDPVGIAVEVGDLLSSVQPSAVVGNTEGYCFEFDNSLAEDQSFAMRLSKLLFVVENVVLGNNKLGFGLGRCIGDAGDNLYVRVLSDGGIPYFVLLLVLWCALFTLSIKNTSAGTDWNIFLGILFLVSFFYDTLYFSRVAPFIFIAISVVASGSDFRFLLQRMAFSYKVPEGIERR